ncbi:MAG: GspE/PulE family protein, partial [Endomicrobiia bacterium]
RVVDKDILSRFLHQKLLGEILVEEKIITKQQLNEVVEIQKKYKEKLGEILIKFGYCTPKQILYALAKQLGIKGDIEVK